MNLEKLINLEKYLLMLRCLKRMKKIDSNNAKLHSCLMKFLKLSKSKFDFEFIIIIYIYIYIF
jgi:hypothetical protein